MKKSPPEHSSEGMDLFRCGIQGYFISPEDSRTLETALANSPLDNRTRWKLLGFYFAHRRCCPQNREQRVAHILWVIDNQREFEKGGTVLLKLFPPEDDSDVDVVRDAWQRRIHAEPTDIRLLENMARFLVAVRPHDASKYYEEALRLSPDRSDLKESLKSSRRYAKKYGDWITAPHPPMTCYFEVISAVDKPGRNAAPLSALERNLGCFF